MVLITSIPQILDSKHKIRQFVSFVPGGINCIWLYCDTQELNKLYEKQEDAWSIVDKKHKKDIEGASAVIPLLTLEELVPPVKRLKHKAGFLGMCGTEVDTIEWCAKEIGRLNREIDKWRKMLSGKTKFVYLLFRSDDG
uniref:CSC1/OSCA1-like cytosolic domain-containing protein n=1 Tax=Moniliophthora roreri TaxID=221103 RepID=A0A0W0F2I6_MONRR